MKRFVFILSLTVILQTHFIGNAHALRTSHRPWLARDTDAVYLETDATPRTRRSFARSRKPLSSRSHTRQGDQIAKRAIHYKGVKYRFGGTTKSKGFDCSGLVQRVYNDLHLDKVPRTAGGLYKSGHPVHLNELRPGDLVFFKNTYKHGISHVGVYAGGNRFIHAQNRRHGVTVTTLSEPYYQLHYAGARRLY